MAYRKSLCASTVLVQAKQLLSTLIQENSYFLEEKKKGDVAHETFRFVAKSLFCTYCTAVHQTFILCPSY